MNPASLVRIVAFAFTTLYTIVLFLTHTKIEDTPTKLLSYIPTVVGFGVLVFDLWVWRFPGVHWFVARPRIGGSWIGTLHPTPESRIPTGGNRGPIQAALVVEQSYWSVGITLMTAESSSQSTSASLRSEPDSPGRRVLSYTYSSLSQQAHRKRSPSHLGASQLRVVGRLPAELQGTYWTDRLTVGDMTFRLVDRNVDYASCEAVVKAAEAKAKAAAEKAAKKSSPKPPTATAEDKQSEAESGNKTVGGPSPSPPGGPA